ncbi:MAG: undecaprenyl-diphosphate phosphatase [Sphingobacteriales bacterium]|nr:MAG: undecaprenyl-diphosphate phosphatase [Sphingobacteriales bacterium]
MTTAEAIILAIVEGVTEFLPVSSTGHMIITSSLMGIAGSEFTKTFTVAIQFGAILSVVALYWKRFFQTINFYLKLFVAFIPAAIIGFLLGDQIDALLENEIVVAFALLLGGIVLLFIDKWFNHTEASPKNEITYPKALKIGLFQCIALIPGVSRSAATIIGGLAQGMNRKAAAEFSFFLAVPTMFAATAYKMLKFYKEGNGFTGQEINMLLIGNIVAFIVAMLAIKTFITFLTKYGFKAFGYYRIVVGLIILILHFIGIELQII